MWDSLVQIWPILVTGFDVTISITAAAHVVLYKRDARAAIGWVGIIWLAPIVGTLLYICFGVNRIHRRAQAIWRHQPRTVPEAHQAACTPEDIERVLGPEGAHLKPLIDMVADVSKRPLLDGNRIEPLYNGDMAYASMLAAITAATRSITLCTYIFDNDRAGERFVLALQQAIQRGVAVRVLIDGVGKRYSFPSIVRKLRRAGVPVATFLPTLIPWRFHYMNLRNHRKILVVDGLIGFTGGMNIREGDMLDLKPRYPQRDLHFRLAGPVVAHLQEAFAIDWEFSTDEKLEGELWFAAHAPVGGALARGILDGPDDDFDKLQMTMLGALGCARKSVIVMTAYFLPDEALISALNVAAMRGVEVHIVLPKKSNLPLVQWASTAMHWQVLECGCQVWLSPPPFSHAKLMLVDGVWTFLGSANWDPRSLSLNFEFNVECYDRELTGQLEDFARQSMDAAHSVTLDEVDSRPIAIRLRDGIARLASPYL